MRMGWIGTGVMGRSMAGHFLAAGCEVRVHNRTREKAESLVAAGATWSSTAAGVATDAEVVCMMVGFPRDVEQVALGPSGVLAAMRPGTLFIDFTTSSPTLAREMFSVAERRGIEALDAPVSGGDVGAREARLSIMVGGTAEGYRRALPLLEKLGKTLVHQGAAGSGQHAKMVNQILIATNMIGVCEGLVYARRAGLDPQAVLKSVGGGAAASWSLSHLAPRILNGDLQPGFYVKHFLKDLTLAMEEAERMKLDLPGLALARRLYERVREEGGENLGTQALIQALDAEKI